jgi:hypothetical protein
MADPKDITGLQRRWHHGLLRMLVEAMGQAKGTRTVDAVLDLLC